MAPDGWERAQDPEEVHSLLLESDAYQAQRYGVPAPRRDPRTTGRRVEEGTVHLLRDRAGAPAAMFTLSWTPGFAEPPETFPSARRPAYMSRLVVRAGLLDGGSLAGVRCVRRALALAAEGDADVLRAEINPDLTATRELLTSLGFVQHGPVHADAERRRAYLQRDLEGGA
jgi:hypothetical protein